LEFILLNLLIKVSIFNLYVYSLLKIKYNIKEYFSNLEIMTSPSKGGINTAILEGHVKDVISSAKTKIQEL
jgi:hypothetical protein